MLWCQQHSMASEQGFSRRDEYQADTTAWDLLASEKNHYSPRFLYAMLAKLDWLETLPEQQGQADKGGILDAWSSTHPETKARRAMVRWKWEKLGEQEKRRLCPSHLFDRNECLS